MCPLCVTTVAAIAAGTTSTGGAAALVVSRLRARNKRNKENDMSKNRERVMENRNELRGLKTPPIVSPQEWEARAPEAPRQGEGPDPRP